VFLVRHAERAEDGTPDPPISDAGEARARLLAEMLRDAGLTRIHTTDYIRTRATGRPTARAVGLDMELYDPEDLAGADLEADRLEVGAEGLVRGKRKVAHLEPGGALEPLALARGPGQLAPDHELGHAARGLGAGVTFGDDPALVTAGLEDGDRVVTTRLDLMFDGMAVAPLDD